jgi:hypothetical protein
MEDAEIDTEVAESTEATEMGPRGVISANL